MNMRFLVKTEKRGSALLIVLGFLSFMIISAVSFAIYMRVERQSSSSYRHAVVGRHLLQSALYRAIDQVDADLLGGGYTVVNGEEIPTAGGQTRKFPDHWKAGGRVFTSASDSTEVEQARVLSLEALSFLPAALVNDVRVASLGAHWRRMGIGAGNNKRDVGRYAYICVNLSDMLNVNGCTNMVRGVSNVVSIASLFPNNKATQFSERAKQDISYLTLQDFYACMNGETKNYLGQVASDTPVASDSPAIEFMESGEVSLFNYDNAQNHLLVTDGFAKTPPLVNIGACNVTLTPPPPSPYDMPNKFLDKIKEVFKDDMVNVNTGGKIFATMLDDYLAPDTDAVKDVATPSGKLAPMICQVFLGNAISPMITSVQNGLVTEYSLSLISVPPIVANGDGLKVRVCFPFKNVETRIRSYTLAVEGFIRVDKKNGKPNLLSTIRADDPDTEIRPFTGNATVTPNVINAAAPADTSKKLCYKWVGVRVNILDASPIKMVNSNDQPLTPGYNPAGQINVALVITSMKVLLGGAVVDSVPESKIPDSGLPAPLARSKLYFQTAPVSTKAVGPIQYRWDSLEVADPRFNHYAVNWVSNGRQPGGSPQDANYNSQVLGPHDITTELLGKDGRDADIFMMAPSGKGKLQSVGELGFIVRPYNFVEQYGLKPVDFATKTALDPSKDDSAAFFRTVRLYDHGAGYPRDEIYKNFYMAMDADGNLPPNANVRINPLSPVEKILGLALDRVPYNYMIAGGGVAPTTPAQNFTEGALKTDWDKFSLAWATTFMDGGVAASLNTNMTARLYDTYGSDTLMGWYSSEKNERKTIFKGGFTASAPVYEIDRKMLYSFSLDSMSDRQQLFLYVFQAEVVAPLSFAQSRSLAGGRAVAVVWRDPYPKGGTGDYHEHKVLFYKQLDN